MKLPAKKERHPFYNRLIDQCFVSRSRRRNLYEIRQRYYLWGSEDSHAMINKIESHIDTLSAILYSGDTARFTVDLPTGVDPKVAARAPAVSKKLNEIFHDEHLDVMFGLAVNWALVYNCMFIKLVPRANGMTPYLVEPQTFGVLREDIPSLDRQEAFTHEYYISKTELETRLEGHPNKADILSKVAAASPKEPTSEAGPIRAIATSVAYGANIKGYLDSSPVPDDYLPQTSVDLIKLTELWLKDDDLKDYRTVLRAGVDQYIYDGINLSGVPQDHNFIQVCPTPLYSYFWGESECARLKGLQTWRNERVEQVRRLLNLNVDPPAVFTGFPMVDEKKFALRTPGSMLTSQLPNAKMDVARPEIPQDAFAEISEIDAQFDDVSGTIDLYQGKAGDSKTGAHAEMLGQFGSLRPRKKALVVEDCLDALATKMYKFLRAYYTETITTDDGDKFPASEYPDDVVIKTDGHSQSPVFSGMTQDLAERLLKAQAIDRASYIEMLNPPGVEELLGKLKTIQQQEAQKHAEDVKLQEEKILHGRRS